MNYMFFQHSKTVPASRPFAPPGGCFSLAVFFAQWYICLVIVFFCCFLSKVVNPKG